LSISTFTTYGADRTHIDWLSSGFPKQITDQVTGLKLQFNYDRYERPYSIISSDGETKRTWQYTYSATVRGGKAMAKVALPRVIKESGTVAKGAGQSGKQARLKELANDPKLGKADRGWIKQEQNSIERGNRKTIRNPPGKDLAHERGREAAKGYSYEHSNLQDRDLHRL
ncbi:polymorphic toxin type 8 domain-containing protein, partial [Fastidiosibacter lacustris]|uniref:polymorphic toxin type 8 domain-containing protein n=1 Tax=Fastidiosibacter lacustris TaxID=2056695 RepID=UPI00195B39C0